jgi:hypothetical protein
MSACPGAVPGPGGPRFWSGWRRAPRPPAGWVTVTPISSGGAALRDRLFACPSDGLAGSHHGLSGPSPRLGAEGPGPCQDELLEGRMTYHRPQVRPQPVRLPDASGQGLAGLALGLPVGVRGAALIWFRTLCCGVRPGKTSNFGAHERGWTLLQMRSPDRSRRWHPGPAGSRRLGSVARRCRQVAEAPRGIGPRDRGVARSRR